MIKFEKQIKFENIEKSITYLTIKKVAGKKGSAVKKAKIILINIDL